MKQCNNLKYDNVVDEHEYVDSGFIILCGAFLLLSFLWLGISIRDFFSTPNMIRKIINLFLGFLEAAFIFYYGFCCASEASARYQVQTEGILIQYPFRQSKIIPWEVFQEVCVCYADITSRGPLRYNTIICCVKHGEKRNFYDRWKTGNALRYQRLIRIAYSEDRLVELQTCCPFQIFDRRGIGGYRIH